MARPGLSPSGDHLATETTAIGPNRTRSYDATAATSTTSITSSESRPISRNGAGGAGGGGGAGNTATNGRGPEGGTADGNTNQPSEQDKSSKSIKSKFLSKLGSIELENKGSVARDHLALERTFLAWLRTSLAFASIGIAITQLFRLNSGTASSSSDSASTQSSANTLHQLGKPLGATFLGIAILVLIIGINRYYESQAWLLQGKFPASRGSVLLLTVVAAALITTSLVIILVVGPGWGER